MQAQQSPPGVLRSSMCQEEEGGENNDNKDNFTIHSELVFGSADGFNLME